MNKIILALLLVTTVHISYSQTVPQEITTKFFDIYKKGDTDKAVDYLFSNNPYSKDIQEGIDDLKRQLKKHQGTIGKFHGADLLATRTAGENIIMFTYVVRHDREPFVFNIMYYNPNGKWQMQNFKFGNSIDDELEEASKAYRMKENYE
jgi:hypothetical protein